MKIIEILSRAFRKKQVDTREELKEFRERAWDIICVKDPRNPGCKIYDL